MAKRGNPNVLDAGLNTRFGSGQSIENNGRRPNILKQFIEKNDLSASDISAIIKNIISTATEESLIEYENDEKKPYLIRYFCRIFRSEFDAGRFCYTDQLFNRAFGMARQIIEQNINENPAAGKTREEQEKAIREILEQVQKKE